MKLRMLTGVLALIALAPAGTAGIVTGRVVDAAGNGVANVDIDFDNEGSGGRPNVSQDFTDANGFFTTTVTPDGIYTVYFNPPAPPTTTLMVGVVPDLAVVGTVDMGDVVLQTGVALSGRVLSGINGLPVEGVNVDVLDSAGNNLNLIGDTTNPLGQFAVAVPTGDLEVRFKTAGVLGSLLAPWSTDVTLAGPTSMGDVTLEQGYQLSALMKTSVGGAAVAGVDLDVLDAATGVKLFTPGDTSTGSGLIDVVVPAGLFDLEFCPQFANKLVAVKLSNQAVAANTFLGNVLFSPGVVLSGVVSGNGVGGLLNVDVDVRVTGTGHSILLCGDNTNSAGAYAVVIPTGTFDVSFTPPNGSPYGPLTVPGVVVTANKIVSATLTTCGALTSYCTPGTSASGCAASLSGSGTPSATAASGFDLIADSVEGSKTGLFFYGTSGRQAAPWGNGTSFQCVVPPVKRGALVSSGGTNGACDGSFSYDLNARWNAKPNHNPGAGALVQAQLWYRDPLNTSNQVTSLSDALEFTVCP